MTETGIVSVHISPELKRDAEKAPAKLSLTPEEAIEDFYQRIAAAYRAEGEARLSLPRVTCCLCRGRISDAFKPASDDDEAGVILNSLAWTISRHISTGSSRKKTMLYERENYGWGVSSN